MALEDKFPQAGLLTGLGWLGLPLATRISKIAMLYRRDERAIEGESRCYDGPTLRISKIYILHHYTPVRGQWLKEAKLLLTEVERQIALRKRRTENLPYTFERQSVHNRRRNLAKRCYSIQRGVGYDRQILETEGDPIEVASVAGCLAIVDAGGIFSKPRLYVRNRATGEQKCIIIDAKRGALNSLGAMMMFIGPKLGIRAMLSGQPVSFDFDNEGFIVGGKTLPLQNVLRVVRGPGGIRLRTTSEPKGKTTR